MTLQQLKYMTLIAQCGTLTQAAQCAYIAQPSLSASLKEVERELGFALFHRTNRGLVATQEGREFLAYGRQVVDQYALLEGKYLQNQGVKRRFAISSQHYSFAVAAFISLTAHVDLEAYDFGVRETTTQDVVEDVRHLRSELGILHLSAFNRTVLSKVFADGDLEFHPLRNCDIYVYLWGEHPLAAAESIPMEALNQYPCLSFELGANSSLYFAEEVLSTHSHPKTIKATDRGTMLNLMKGLQGYTLCSGIISQQLNGAGYVAIPLETEEQMELGYIKRKGIPLSPLGEQYLVHLYRAMGEEVVHDEIAD